ncbi:MAG: DUF4956 domain-containing protein [Ilumatobacteraceae bacterium]
MIALADPARLAADAVAMLILVFGLYFPRHRRRDMVVAIISVNVGVVAVAMVLARADVGAGLGLGLFGVLSIIRLRSIELDQEEIAYYFSAIALGLLGGVQVGPDWVAPVLMGAIVLGLFVGDHPRLFASYRSHGVTLDSAITDETELRHRLELLLGGTVVRMKVKRIDLVSDLTVVDVRYRIVSPGES